MPDDSRPTSKPRRPYESPRIVESGTFEQLVLACAFNPNVAACEPCTSTSTPSCNPMSQPNS